MTCENVRVETTDSKVKVEEGKRKAVFKNGENKKFFKTKVDGGLVNNQVSADFVVTKSDVGSVIVELKGTDVKRGAEQVIATVLIMKECGAKALPVAGLIVCAQYPSIDSGIQRLSASFTRMTKGPLHVVTKNDEFEIEKVLSPSGPR